MKIKTLSLKHDIYSIEDIFTNHEFSLINDEFTYGRWIFDKKESTETSNYPYRGHLETKNSHYGEVDIVGYNNVLNNFAINIKYKIQQLLFDKPLVLRRINTNIQFFGMESSFHRDNDFSNHWSFVCFVSPNWNSSWGGEFVVNVKDSEYIHSPYIPNRGVLFPSHFEHMGYSPNRLCNIPRLSIAFVYELLL